MVSLVGGDIRQKTDVLRVDEGCATEIRDDEHARLGHYDTRSLVNRNRSRRNQSINYDTTVTHQQSISLINIFTLSPAHPSARFPLRWRSTLLPDSDNIFKPGEQALLGLDGSTWTFSRSPHCPRLHERRLLPTPTHGISTRSAIPSSSSIHHPSPISTSHPPDHTGMLSARPPES